jgi:hypothetical protein
MELYLRRIQFLFNNDAAPMILPSERMLPKMRPTEALEDTIRVVGYYTQFQGRWLAIIRSGYKQGDIKVSVEADGLKKSEVTIQAKQGVLS